MIPLYERPELLGDAGFVLKSEYQPAGDQPQAIQELVDGLKRNEKNQVLLGITGSGKTFTVTKPPLENTTSGLICFNIFFASLYPLITRKGSEKFLGSKYLRNLPVEMP